MRRPETGAYKSPPSLGCYLSQKQGVTPDGYDGVYVVTPKSGNAVEPQGRVAARPVVRASVCSANA
jgi:hypothetical protein